MTAYGDGGDVLPSQCRQDKPVGQIDTEPVAAPLQRLHLLGFRAVKAQIRREVDDLVPTFIEA
jgi:hypothetical protein